MSIALRVAWHAVVDDMRKVVHVQSSCCHIRSDEQLREMLAELLHGDVALLLREVAVLRYIRRG